MRRFWHRGGRRLVDVPFVLPGHETSVRQTRPPEHGNWVAECSCGWQVFTPTKGTDLMAIRQAVKHRQQVAFELRSQGLRVPSLSGEVARAVADELRPGSVPPGEGVSTAAS